jgi:hypothetical protein
VFENLGAKDRVKAFVWQGDRNTRHHHIERDFTPVQRPLVFDSYVLNVLKEFSIRGTTGPDIGYS